MTDITKLIEAIGMVAWPAIIIYSSSRGEREHRSGDKSWGDGSDNITNGNVRCVAGCPRREELKIVQT